MHGGGFLTPKHSPPGGVDKGHCGTPLPFPFLSAVRHQIRGGLVAVQVWHECSRILVMTSALRNYRCAFAPGGDRSRNIAQSHENTQGVPSFLHNIETPGCRVLRAGLGACYAHAFNRQHAFKSVFCVLPCMRSPKWLFCLRSRLVRLRVGVSSTSRDRCLVSHRDLSSSSGLFF